MARDEIGKFNKTLFQCFDLNNKDGFEVDVNTDPDKNKHLAADIPPDKFFFPGSALEIMAHATTSGTGAVQQVTFKLDENGKQTALLTGVIRYAGADKINALFK